MTTKSADEAGSLPKLSECNWFPFDNGRAEVCMTCHAVKEINNSKLSYAQACLDSNIPRPLRSLHAINHRLN